MRRFAEDPLLVAALGATGTDAAREALVAYDEAALPLLSVVDGDIRHLNRIFLCARPRNDLQMLPVAQFLGAYEIDRIALVDDGTEYGRRDHPLPRRGAARQRPHGARRDRTGGHARPGRGG